MFTKNTDTQVIFKKFEVGKCENCVYLIDKNVNNLYKLSSKINSSNYLVLESNERLKSLVGLKKVLDFFLELQIDRATEVVAIGGGTLLDLVGFCSSIFKRGITVNYVPTTLLSMADASIGGKNGVNYKSIKNLLGTYHFPKNVIIDIDFLDTLPTKYLISGYIEILKVSMVVSNEFYHDLLKNDINNIKNNKLHMNINKSIEYKINIIKNDLYDNNKRKILNFGHTIGHSIELTYRLPHGIAVAYGILFALKLSNKYFDFEKSKIDDFRNFLKKVKIYPEKKFSLDKIVKNLSFDKKRHKDSIDIILLEDIGTPVIFNINYETFISDLKDLLKS